MNGKKSPKFNCILNQDDLSHFKPKILTKDHIINKQWIIYETYIISYSACILCPLYFLLSFSFFFFPLSIPSIFIMHFFFAIYFLCIKQLTSYNLYNKFYLTLVILIKTCSQTQLGLGIDSFRDCLTSPLSLHFQLSF